MHNNDDTQKGFPYNRGFKSMYELRMMISAVPQDRLESLVYWETSNGNKNGLMQILGIMPAENPLNNVYEDMEARDRWFGILRRLAVRKYMEKSEDIRREHYMELQEIERMRIEALLATPKPSQE